MFTSPYYCFARGSESNHQVRRSASFFLTWTSIKIDRTKTLSELIIDISIVLYLYLVSIPVEMSYNIQAPPEEEHEHAGQQQAVYYDEDEANMAEIERVRAYF